MALRGKRKNGNKVIKKPNAKNAKNMSNKVLNKYIRIGIAITQINADNECYVLDGEVGEIIMNIVGERAGDMERSVRTVKEQTRCHVH